MRAYEASRVHAPALEADYWLNLSPQQEAPSRPDNWAGRIVLIDFFDYTCLNCLNTLAYLKAWHERYSQYGLLVLGVHTPEFSFATEQRTLEQGLRELGVTYPVAADNRYSIWQAFANRYWPAKYLIDQEGIIRYYHHGEGLYQDTERTIQSLLAQLPNNADITFPEPLANLRPLDDLSVGCSRPTPELYLGYRRGIIGNEGAEHFRDTAMAFRLPEVRLPETVFLQGGWHADAESIEYVGEEEAPEVAGVISLHYQAAEVNLVMQSLTPSVLNPGISDNNDALTPSSPAPIKVLLALDEAPLPAEAWGADVVLDEVTRLPCVWVGHPRMYRLVNTAYFESHELRLQVRQKGLRAYAFTFASAPLCAAGPVFGSTQ